MKLNSNDQRVLEILAEDEDYSDFCYWSFASICSRTGLERQVVRRACRSLKRKGLTEFSAGLWTEEGEPAGSGYAITPAGLRWLKQDA